MNEKSKTPLVDKFLTQYISSYSADCALKILLKKHREQIEPLFEAKDPYWFHKAFRQTDVCDSADVDMMIWHLIHASQDFYDALHWFWNHHLDNMSERRMDFQLLEKCSKIKELEEELETLKKGKEND